jgi:hypothetical protein
MAIRALSLGANLFRRDTLSVDLPTPLRVRVACRGAPNTKTVKEMVDERVSPESTILVEYRFGRPHVRGSRGRCFRAHLRDP